MANKVYTQFLTDIANGTEDFDAGTNYLLVLFNSTSTYAFNPDHKFLSDITGNGGIECTGTGYSRKTLASRTVTQDDTNDRVSLSAANVTWTALTAGTIKFAAICQEGASDAARRLVSYYDTGAGFPLTTNGGDVTFQVATAGLLTLATA